MGKRSNPQICSRFRDNEVKILEGNERVDYMGNYYATNHANLAKAFGTDHIPLNLEEAKCSVKFSCHFVPLSDIEQYMRMISATFSPFNVKVTTCLLFNVLSKIDKPRLAYPEDRR